MRGPFPLVRWAFIAGAALAAIGVTAWLVQRARADREPARGALATMDGVRGDTNTAAAGGVCRLAPAGIPLPADVHEASGVAASRSSPGYAWILNDQGDPQLLAAPVAGGAGRRVRVTGAEVGDWEDLAIGPCASGSCLYVADIGDNQAERAQITVYRVPEPGPADSVSAPAEALHATYPDGPQDAEAIFVTPDSGVYIVSKGETGPIALYRFPRPFTPGAVARLERVFELGPAASQRSGRVTGASASPDGRWVALRGLHSTSFYRAAELLAGRRGEPVRVDLAGANEAQGEGIALAEGGVMYLVSEGVGKRNPAVLTRAECTLPPG